MMEVKGKDKLWKIEIGEKGNFYQFYLISMQKPIFVLETGFGKFRRMFTLFSGSYYSPQLPPIFHISPGQKATAEKTQKMHGFNLHKLTSRHIILSIENPGEKSLYEISLFSKKIKNLRDLNEPLFASKLNKK
ncbi:MAG: hypothetical protein U9O41_08410 [Candidatus Aerophobetes bacterium]|nr:hypothetical protein [Candidatus Aerophobetes bacterium]